jgi:hypothetical protein
MISADSGTIPNNMDVLDYLESLNPILRRYSDEDLNLFNYWLCTLTLEEQYFLCVSEDEADHDKWRDRSPRSHETGESLLCVLADFL